MLGMGIAVACCITAYLNWDFSTNFDKNHVNSESIYRVQAYYDDKGKQNRHAMVPAPLGAIVKENFTDVEKVVRYTTENSDIRIGDEVFNTSIAYADDGFFDLFTFNGTFRYDKSSVVISRDLALKYFNTVDAEGRQITQITNGQQKSLR